MEFIVGLTAYLVLGVLFSIWMGLSGEYDYEPKPSQVSPNTLKYLVVLIWVIPFVHGCLLTVGGLFSGVNEKINKAMKVRH